MAKGRPTVKAKKAFAVIESMTAPYHVRFQVRVWRDEEHLTVSDWDNGDIHQQCNYSQTQNEGMSQLAARLASMPRVSAVEVKDLQGNGIVLYSEWP